MLELKSLKLFFILFVNAGKDKSTDIIRIKIYTSKIHPNNKKSRSKNIKIINVKIRILIRRKTRKD